MVKRNFKFLLCLVGLFALVKIGSLVGEHFGIKNPGEVYYQKLHEEFKKITPPPHISIISRTDIAPSWISWRTRVGAKYTTDLSFLEFSAFYDKQLQSLGWHRVGKQFPHDDDMFYCKNDLTALLESNGSKGPDGWSYSMEVSWGFNEPPFNRLTIRSQLPR